MKFKNVLNLFGRYFVLIALGLFNLKLFYFVFTPLTVYPVFWILSLFDEGTRLLAGNLLFYDGIYAEIIAACVAGAAYYLLLILNLSTPMKVKKRVESISFLILSFLALNIIRISVFTALFASGFEAFDLAHKFTWYFGSTALIVLIWFVNVWIFKIKSIPIYTDAKNIFGDIK